MKPALILLILNLPSFSFAQPVLEWTSPTTTASKSGWKILRENPLETRYFISDSVSYRLMTGPLSSTVAVTIPVVPSEIPFGYPVARDVADVSGDGINDIVLERNYGTFPSREGLRVVNTMTGLDIFLLDNTSYSYSLVTFTETVLGVADIDHDGRNELVVKKYPYPFTSDNRFVYEVYHTSGTSTSVGARSSAAPSQISLDQNFPNPFNPTTQIQYDLSKAGVATIEIFDVNGRLVRTFANQHQEPGSYRIAWDGKDNSGLSVSTGTYFYRLDSDGASLAKKMILLK